MNMNRTDGNKEKHVRGTPMLVQPTGGANGTPQRGRVARDNAPRRLNEASTVRNHNVESAMASQLLMFTLKAIPRPVHNVGRSRDTFPNPIRFTLRGFGWKNRSFR